VTGALSWVPPANKSHDQNVPLLKDGVDGDGIDYALDSRQMARDIFQNDLLMPRSNRALGGASRFERLPGAILVARW